MVAIGRNGIVAALPVGEGYAMVSNRPGVRSYAGGISEQAWRMVYDLAATGLRTIPIARLFAGRRIGSRLR